MFCPKQSQNFWGSSVLLVLLFVIETLRMLKPYKKLVKKKSEKKKQLVKAPTISHNDIRDLPSSTKWLFCFHRILFWLKSEVLNILPKSVTKPLLESRTDCMTTPIYKREALSIRIMLEDIFIHCQPLFPHTVLCWEADFVQLPHPSSTLFVETCNLLLPLHRTPNYIKLVK